MKPWICRRGVLIAVALVARLAGAQESSRPAVAARLSTLGAGLEVIAPFSEYLNLRLGLNYGGVDYQDTQQEIDYEVEAKLRSGGALLDWFPAAGGFRLTGGVMYNGSELDGRARPREPKKIGDLRFAPDEIGTLSAKVDFPQWAGYVGFGFGNPCAPGRGRWTVLFDIGVMFYSSPDFELTADGTLADDPVFAANLRKERDRIEDDYVRAARFYPVISLGLGFRF